MEENVFNATKYKNEFKKQYYKQLNVAIPIPLMEEFEEKLKKEKKRKAEFIIGKINEYLGKNVNQEKK